MLRVPGAVEPLVDVLKSVWFDNGTQSHACRSYRQGVKKTLAEMCIAENPDHAVKTAYVQKWIKAAAKITNDLYVLLAFYDRPAEHWTHPRTNLTGSNFITGRSRQWVTKGPGSRSETEGIAMSFTLLESVPLVGALPTHQISSPSSASALSSPRANSPSSSPR